MICEPISLTWRSRTARCGIFGTTLGAILSVASGTSAHAFDPATDHKCVAYCDGGPAPNGGGSAVSAPSGPSPAELARQHQRREALELDARAHAAFDRGELAAAARAFEEAARLAPADSNILGNLWLTKGLRAASERDYETAIDYYRQALRYFPNNKEIKRDLNLAEEKAAVARQDWERAAKKVGQGELTRYYRARQSFSDGNWDGAVTELKEFRTVISTALTKGRKAIRDEQDAIRVIVSVRPQDAATLQRSLAHDKTQVAEWDDLARETDKFLNLALQARAREQEFRRAAAGLTAQQERERQESNPNYPAPPPIYRDSRDPRSYPDLPSYNSAQHAAHKDNEIGNVWANKGDWAQALLSYQRALQQDPDGPFADVLKENIDVAKKHLVDDQTRPASVAVSGPQSSKPQEPSKEVAAPNCTGWMTQDRGTSFRLCTDGQGQRYCEQTNGNDATRVSCQ